MTERSLSAALTVIAEAGVNHNGELGRAREMVAAAAEAGADYVKFQVFTPESLVAKETRTAAYQATNTGETDQVSLLRDLALSIDDFEMLAGDCAQNGVGFLATAFDVSTLGRLIELGMDRIKVASGELTNTPALAQSAEFGLPVLLSTGMSDLAEVREAVSVLRTHGAQDITLLHCTSLYPAPPSTLNLRAMVTLREATDLPVGFSDHSLGDHAAIAAVALGAVAIEKHFTLDRTLPGPDHAASLEPEELRSMIARLREIAVMLGDGVKKPAPGEKETAAVVRRSWHAARDLPAGTVLTESDVALKRPAEGLPPSEQLVGRRLRSPLRADAPIVAADLARG